MADVIASVFQRIESPLFPCIRYGCTGICHGSRIIHAKHKKNVYRATCDICGAVYVAEHTMDKRLINHRIKLGYTVNDERVSLHDCHGRVIHLFSNPCMGCGGRLYIPHEDKLDVFLHYIVTRRHTNDRGRRIIDSDKYVGHQLCMDRDGTYAAKIAERQLNLPFIKERELHIDHDRYNFRMNKRGQSEVSYEKFLELRLENKEKKELIKQNRRVGVIHHF